MEKQQKKIQQLLIEQNCKANISLHLTRMAGGLKNLETNKDVSNLIDQIVEDKQSKIVFMSAALCDFEGSVIDKISPCDFGESTHLDFKITKSGKDQLRLKSTNYNFLELAPDYNKVISKIRKTRKDIFLVGFKTTTGATSQEQYEAGLNLLKKSSCNLVLANDLHTKNNMIITPEEADYHELTDRNYVLKNLVEIALLRSHLTFTRSTVIAGESISWKSDLIPNSLRTIVNYCIDKNAYKPFNGSTVGHFAVKISDNEFLTSKRKTNFNDLNNIGLVKIKTDGPDTVIAYGAKPSVGGQSQRIIFNDHKNYNCVVHFHSPLKADHKDNIPIVYQREVECGSHACGKNTSNGLKKFDDFSCVMLDNHGPNIVFNSSIDHNKIINFIENNFDLSLKTGGYNILK